MAEGMKTNPFDLRGRVALVTGATGRLGRSLATCMANAGAHVHVNGRDAGKVDTLVAALRDRGGTADGAVFDVTDLAASAAVVARLGETHGRLDVLVNNAHSGTQGALETARPESFRAAYEVGVVGAAELVRCALPWLRAAGSMTEGGASVINVASMYGLRSPDPDAYDSPARTNPPYYGAAKAALVQYTRYAAVSLARDRIRVNALAPGPFPPDTLDSDHPTLAAAIRKRTPMARFGQPDELAGPLLLLASDAGSYMTGTVVCVDGGWTAR